MPVTFIKVEPEEGLVECEGCPESFPEDELDEEGYCSECVAGDQGAAADDRYWRSMRS